MVHRIESKTLFREMLAHVEIDWEAIILACMFDQDERIKDCDDAYCNVIDFMGHATVGAHIEELVASGRFAL